LLGTVRFSHCVRTDLLWCNGHRVSNGLAL
jgi:hypothetical protein